MAFFYTGKDHEKLIMRPKDFQDGAMPSSTSLAVTALARLGRLTENAGDRKKAEQALRSHESICRLAPLASGQMFVALGISMDKPSEIALFAGDSEEEFETVLHAVRERFPNRTGSLPP